MMLSIFSCCVSMIGCCGKCCSCCVVVFLSIYKFKIFVFCFGSWFISMYFCGRNSMTEKLLIEKSFCEKNDTEARLTKK